MDLGAVRASFSPLLEEICFYFLLAVLNEGSGLGARSHFMLLVQAIGDGGDEDDTSRNKRTGVMWW